MTIRLANYKTDCSCSGKFTQIPGQGLKNYLIYVLNGIGIRWGY